LFIRLISGFFIVVKRMTADGEVIPLAPVWGSYVITQQRVDCTIKYRYYTFSEDGKLHKDNTAHIERIDGHENLTSKMKDCIGTTILANRLLNNFLMDADIMATSVLAKPPLVKELVQKPEEKPSDPLDMKQQINNFWSMDLSTMLDDKDHVDMERVKNIWEKKVSDMKQKAHEKQFFLALFRSMLNEDQTKKGVSEPSQALNPNAPSQSVENQITLEEGTHLVQQQLPQWRSDLINILNHLKEELTERLGYIPISTIIQRSNRAKSDAKTLEVERRNAVMPWSIVASNMLTTMYRFIYEDVGSITKLFKNKVKDKKLKKTLKQLKEAAKDIEDAEGRSTITLNYQDALPQIVLDDLYDKQLITPTRFLRETLESTAISQYKIDEILSESKGKGLLKIITPEKVAAMNNQTPALASKTPPKRSSESPPSKSTNTAKKRKTSSTEKKE
jgi:hypothetical protein